VYFSLALRKGEVAPARSAVVATVGCSRHSPESADDSFDGYSRVRA